MSLTALVSLLFAALTTILQSCGHEAFECPQLYQRDPDFATTYQSWVHERMPPIFHIQDGLLCHLGPPLCSHKEACKDDLGGSLQSDGKTFWHGENNGCSTKTFLLAKNFDKTSTSISDITLHVPFPSQPSRSKAYTPLFLL
jgi:hypothetical protein